MIKHLKIQFTAILQKSKEDSFIKYTNLVHASAP